MKKNRNKLELWLDKQNHTMEFMRTVVAFAVLIMQIIILYYSNKIILLKETQEDRWSIADSVSCFLSETRSDEILSVCQHVNFEKYVNFNFFEIMYVFFVSMETGIKPRHSFRYSALLPNSTTVSAS